MTTGRVFDGKYVENPHRQFDKEKVALEMSPRCGLYSARSTWQFFVLLASFVVNFSVAYAFTETVNGIVWCYDVNGSTAVLTNAYQAVSFRRLTGDISIPSELGGMSVTHIGAKCFLGDNGIVGVTMPDGIMDIGNRAFEDCSGLMHVSI